MARFIRFLCLLAQSHFHFHPHYLLISVPRVDAWLTCALLFFQMLSEMAMAHCSTSGSLAELSLSVTKIWVRIVLFCEGHMPKHTWSTLSLPSHKTTPIFEKCCFCYLMFVIVRNQQRYDSLEADISSCHGRKKLILHRFAFLRRRSSETCIVCTVGFSSLDDLNFISTVHVPYGWWWLNDWMIFLLYFILLLIS